MTTAEFSRCQELLKVSWLLKELTTTMTRQASSCQLTRGPRRTCVVKESSSSTFSLRTSWRRRRKRMPGRPNQNTRDGAEMSAAMLRIVGAMKPTSKADARVRRAASPLLTTSSSPAASLVGEGCCARKQIPRKQQTRAARETFFTRSLKFSQSMSIAQKGDVAYKAIASDAGRQDNPMKRRKPPRDPRKPRAKRRASMLASWAKGLD
mmetsp:Transcript_5987/g.21086  ORF Transcript_5987/g.21086 Transcript_5987/m.21086 type:complete len:208 (+) Transcript_5987:1519-2142(+)